MKAACWLVSVKEVSAISLEATGWKCLPSWDQEQGLPASRLVAGTHLLADGGLLAATALSSEAVNHILSGGNWPGAFLLLLRLFLDYSYAELANLAP